MALLDSKPKLLSSVEGSAGDRELCRMKAVLLVTEPARMKRSAHALDARICLNERDFAAIDVNFVATSVSAQKPQWWQTYESRTSDDNAAKEYNEQRSWHADIHETENFTR